MINNILKTKIKCSIKTAFGILLMISALWLTASTSHSYDIAYW